MPQANERRFRDLIIATYQAYHDLYASSDELNIDEHVFISENPESTAMAETLIAEQPETLHISIRFSKKIFEDFHTLCDPIKSLSSSNLSLFTIVAEEVSHFQCIVHAALTKSTVSRFDLELQSEFDKFLLAGHLLSQQTGHAHPTHLARLLFDSSRIYREHELYERANNRAAAWWWSQLNHHGDRLFTQQPGLIRSLKKIRHVHGEPKVLSLEGLKPTSIKRTA